jgi:hypothetical protein
MFCIESKPIPLPLLPATVLIGFPYSTEFAVIDTEIAAAIALASGNLFVRLNRNYEYSIMIA